MGIEVLQSATTVLRGRLEINQETTGVDLDGNNSIDPTEAVDGRSDDAVWDFFEANSTRIRQEVVAETITTLLELASDENQEVAAEAQRELGEIAANNSTVAERIAPQATNSQVCTQTAWEDFTGFWQVINNDSFGREVDRINARIARMPCFDLLVWDCIRDDAELASQRGEMSLLSWLQRRPQGEQFPTITIGRRDISLLLRALSDLDQSNSTWGPMRRNFWTRQIGSP